MFREQTKPFLIKVFFVFCSSNKDSFSVPPTLNSVTPSDSSLDYFPLRAFVAQFSAQKLALMPFSLLYRHFLCAILAPHFVGFSPPYRTDAQPQKHTSTNYAPPPPPHPSGTIGLSLQCPWLRMSNVVPVNPLMSKCGIHISTMTPLNIKDDMLGKQEAS